VQAASLLRQAVSAHLSGQRVEAAELICRADIDTIREWTESLWGRNSPYVLYRPSTASPVLPETERQKLRMPTLQEKHKLHSRDGYHCRFCGIPVIRQEIRQRIRRAYPVALRWGRRNADCHAAFQAMWAQYDHVVPHARGGTNHLYNLVVTCAPCNYARMSYTLEEVGLLDPRRFDAVRSNWDGLERFH
jgi:5-methylcytosine-specific restriction endonuclease McrA